MSDERLKEIYELIDDLKIKDLNKVKYYIEDKIENSNKDEFTTCMYDDFKEIIDDSEIKCDKQINKFFKGLKCVEFTEEQADYLISHQCENPIQKC